MIGPEGSEYEATLRSRDVNVTYTFFDGFESMEPSIVEVATIVGGAVTLECDIRASNPAPTIVWFANTNEIDPVLPNDVLYVDEGRYLFIRVLTNTQRNQQYYCEARGLLLNNTVVRSPITYTLTGEIPVGTLMRYRPDLGTTVFKVGDPLLRLPYGLAARESDGSLGVAVVTGCTSDDIDDNQISVSVSANLLVVFADLTPPFENTEAVYSCDILSNVQAASTVTSTLTLGQRAVVTSPAVDADSLIDRERLVGGGSVSYRCEVDGTPTPTVTWYYNGGAVSEGVSVNGRELVIADPQVSHSGIYQCQVTNIIGDAQYEDSRTWILEVRMPEVPDVVSFLRTNPDAVADRLVGTLIVQPVDIANFAVTVMVTSDPCPTVQWSFDGSDISAGDMYQVDDPCADEAAQSPYTYTLTIANLNLTTSGEYSAVFSHLGGSTTLPRLYVTVPVAVEVLSLQREVNSSGDPQCFLSGSVVTLTCNIVGFPRPTIVFRKGTDEIMPGQSGFERVTDIGFDQITISNVVESDEGTYSCEAIVEGSIRLQSPPGDQVYCTFPDITSSSFSPDNPQVGQDLDFECQVTGVPAPTVEWTKDNITLSNAANTSVFVSAVIDGVARVRITEATIEDNGVYRCSATNVAGSASETFSIQNIREVPVVDSLLRTNPNAVADQLVGTLIVQPENTANFAVVVMVISDPCPTVQWSFNGDDVSNGPVYQVDDPCVDEAAQSPYTYTLTIANLNSTTSGEYSAVFSHLGGSTTLPRLYVTVPVPVEVLSLQREVESTGNPQCFLSGSDVTLTCNVVGFPRPTIVFRNDQGDIMPGQAGFERVTNISFDQITISNVTVSDQGTYSCEAGETGLQASEAQTYCTFPDITSSSFSPDNPQVGEDLDFECQVTGVPAPTVEWTKDNISLSNAGNTRVFVSAVIDGVARVRITEAIVEDNGEYRCIVINLAGSDSETFLVQNIRGFSTNTVIIASVVSVVGFLLIVVVIILLLLCVYWCARKSKTERHNPAYAMH